MMKRSVLRSLAVWSPLLFAGFAAPAIGQTPSSDAAGSPATNQNGQTAAPAVPPAAASSASLSDQGIQDIVVTAQRRSENVQRTALSIAAIGAPALAQLGVRDANTLNGIVPGLKVAYQGQQVQLFVRGVGDLTSNSYTQSSVAVNFDGVYLARTAAFGPEFFDTARVEVLRGPQGTLYGRNASGGAINVLSNAPDLSHVSGSVVGEGGNYGLYRFQGVLNLPLSDSFGLRASGQITHRDGYLSDGSNDDKSQAGRLRALWKPSSDLTFNLIGEAAHIGGRGFGRVYRPEQFGNPWTGAQDSRYTVAAYPSLILRNPDQYTNNKYYGITGQMDWTLSPDITFTVIPAYKYFDLRANIAADFLSRDFSTSKTTSVEARLSGNTRAVKWVIGGYYFHEDLDITFTTDQRSAATISGNYQIQTFPKLNSTAPAAFGEATLSITNRFRVIGGLRYTDESRVRNGSIVTYTYKAGNPGDPRILNLSNQTLRAHALTWKGGAEYDISPQNLLFATVSKGFKSGGFDATDADTYRPEYITAYTVGLKNRFLDNRLQLNLEGFYWKYKDQQIAFLGIDSTGTTSLITRNAGQATIYGANVDIVWRPTPLNTFNLGAEYLHTKYDQFTYLAVGNNAAGVRLADGCISNGVVGSQYIENCTGNRLPRSPKFTLNSRLTHIIPLAAGNDLTLGGTVKHESMVYLLNNYSSPNFRQGGYVLFDADITYNAHGRWSLQAFMRNITNKAVYQSASNESSVPPGSGALRGAVSAIAPPRTYGLRLQYNY